MQPCGWSRNIHIVNQTEYYFKNKLLLPIIWIHQQKNSKVENIRLKKQRVDKGSSIFVIVFPSSCQTTCFEISRKKNRRTKWFLKKILSLIKDGHNILQSFFLLMGTIIRSFVWFVIFKKKVVFLVFECDKKDVGEGRKKSAKGYGPRCRKFKHRIWKSKKRFFELETRRLEADEGNKLGKGWEHLFERKYIYTFVDFLRLSLFTLVREPER